MLLPRAVDEKAVLGTPAFQHGSETEGIHPFHSQQTGPRLHLVGRHGTDHTKDRLQVDESQKVRSFTAHTGHGLAIGGELSQRGGPVQVVIDDLLKEIPVRGQEEKVPHHGATELGPPPWTAQKVNLDPAVFEPGPLQALLGSHLPGEPVHGLEETLPVRAQPHGHGRTRQDSLLEEGGSAGKGQGQGPLEGLPQLLQGKGALPGRFLRPGLHRGPEVLHESLDLLFHPKSMEIEVLQLPFQHIQTRTLHIEHRLHGGHVRQAHGPVRRLRRACSGKEREGDAEQEKSGDKEAVRPAGCAEKKHRRTF